MAAAAGTFPRSRGSTWNLSDIRGTQQHGFLRTGEFRVEAATHVFAQQPDVSYSIHNEPQQSWFSFGTVSTEQSSVQDTCSNAPEVLSNSSLLNFYKALISPTEQAIIGNRAVRNLIHLLQSPVTDVTTPYLHHGSLPIASSPTSPILLGCLSFRKTAHAPRRTGTPQQHATICRPACGEYLLPLISAAAVKPKDWSRCVGGDDSVLVDDANGLLAVADGVGAWSTSSCRESREKTCCPVGLFSLDILARLQRNFRQVKKRNVARGGRRNGLVIAAGRKGQHRYDGNRRSISDNSMMTDDDWDDWIDEEKFQQKAAAAAGMVNHRSQLHNRIKRCVITPWKCNAPRPARKMLQAALNFAAYKAATEATSFGGTTLLAAAIEPYKNKHAGKKDRTHSRFQRRLRVVRVGDSDLAVLRKNPQGQMEVMFKTESSRKHFNFPSQITRLPSRQRAREIKHLIYADIFHSIARLRDMYVEAKKTESTKRAMYPYKSSPLTPSPSGRPNFLTPLNCLPAYRTSRNTLIPYFEQATVLVQRGDLIVVGTDGLFDNLFPEELTATVTAVCNGGNASPKDIAEELCLRAYRQSRSSLSLTPFTQAAVRAGYGPHVTGGKPDDISVIVSWVA